MRDRVSPHWTVIVALIVAVACDGLEPAGPNGAGAITRPGFEVGTGETNCPEEVPEADCIPLTWQERQTLWWDLDVGIKWYEPACFDVGEQLQDFVLTGDVRKWPEGKAGTTIGFWELVGVNPVDQISFDEKLFRQGWMSERTLTAIHEGFHLHRQGGSEFGPDGARYFASFCINN